MPLSSKKVSIVDPIKQKKTKKEERGGILLKRLEMWSGKEENCGL